MISQEHLEHWLKEIRYQLNGIVTEIDPKKVILTGVNVGSDGGAFVSFEYLNEKSKTIQGVLKNIEYDMKHDEDTMKLINDALKDVRQIE